MSELRIYPENGANLMEIVTGHGAIASRLDTLGVVFEHWSLSNGLDRDAGQDEIIEAYRENIDRLMRHHDLESLDVIRMAPNHPRCQVLRGKFMREHIHPGMEIRFFVEGRVLFYLRKQDRVYSVCCKPGNVIGIPAGMAHWVDVGEHPRFTAIRLFPGEGEARFTGNRIADRFPRLEEADRKQAKAI